MALKGSLIAWAWMKIGAVGFYISGWDSLCARTLKESSDSFLWQSWCLCYLLTDPGFVGFGVLTVLFTSRTVHGLLWLPSSGCVSVVLRTALCTGTDGLVATVVGFRIHQEDVQGVGCWELAQEQLCSTKPVKMR